MAVCLITACSKKEATEVEPANITRLEMKLNGYADLDSDARSAIRDSFRTEFEALTEVLTLGPADDATLTVWSGSMPMEMFTPQVRKVFPNVDSLELAIATIMKRADAQGLKLPKLRYATTVWGRPESMIFTDSVLLIALNHYLGSDNEAYAHWPEYRRNLKRPQLLPYDIAEALVATAYPYTDDNPTVQSRMLYEGALVQAKMMLVPNATADKALGFTTEQYRDVKDNRSFIWQKIVSGKMLTSTDADLIDRLFALLPSSTPISNDAPGRAARIIGYEAAQSYAEKHPEAKLSDLFNPAYYTSPEALSIAGYAGPM